MYYYVFKYTFHFLTEAHVPFESEVQASQRGIRRIHHQCHGITIPKVSHWHSAWDSIPQGL